MPIFCSEIVFIVNCLPNTHTTTTMMITIACLVSKSYSEVATNMSEHKNNNPHPIKIQVTVKWNAIARVVASTVQHRTQFFDSIKFHWAHWPWTNEQMKCIIIENIRSYTEPYGWPISQHLMYYLRYVHSVHILDSDIPDKSKTRNLCIWYWYYVESRVQSSLFSIASEWNASKFHALFVCVSVLRQKSRAKWQILWLLHIYSSPLFTCASNEETLVLWRMRLW